MKQGQTRFRLIAVVVMALGTSGLYLQSPRGHALQQPIAYSHKLHAGDLQMNCLYCHDGARRSAVAGVPSVQRCM